LTAAITWHPDDVVNIDLRSVSKGNSPLNWELVRDSAKVDDLLGELESRSDYVTLEGQCEHLRAAFQGEAESFRELSEYVALEGDFDEVTNILIDTKYTLSLAEMEFGAERSLVWDQLPVAVNLSGVLNTDSEFFLEVHEDVADVLLWKRELSLRTLALAGHVQGEPLL